MRTCRLLLLVVVVAAAGCRATYARKLDVFRARYAQADFAGADAAIDAVIAKESGTDLSDVAATQARAAPPGRRSTALLLLEKSMTQLALDNPETAIELLRRARKVFDERQKHKAREFFGAVLSDDRALEYRGADYEHILIRVMLCLADLVVHSSQTAGDAYAYALQVGEKQEQILGSPLGEDFGYRPRQEYRRVGIGAYLQGVVLEATGARDGAARAYARCLDYEPGFLLAEEGLRRAEGGAYAPAGEGVVHVFYLGGPGPHYEEGTSPPTEIAMRIAQWIAAVLVDSPVPLAQAPVPVPVPVRRTYDVAPLPVEAAGRATETEMLLDVNLVATQQLDAMMPLIVARAVVRRAVKATATTAVGEIGRHRKARDRALIELGAALANLIWTSAERADTRLWSSLPAQIHAARLPLPAGVHRVRLGGATEAQVRVAAGRDTYVLVVRPDPSRPGAVVVDNLSRVKEDA